MASRLSNLGSSLEIRFNQLGNSVDLDKAIECMSEAILLTPQGDPQMPIWLSNIRLGLHAPQVHFIAACGKATVTHQPVPHETC